MCVEELKVMKILLLNLLCIREIADFNPKINTSNSSECSRSTD